MGTEKAKGVLGLLFGDTHYAGSAYPLVTRDTPSVFLAIMLLQYESSIYADVLILLSSENC